MKLFKCMFTVALTFIFLSACAQDSKIKNHPAKQLETVTTNPENILLDVRTDEEYDAGHVRNSIHINIYSEKFEEEVLKTIPDKTKTVYVYCKSGKRSMQASEKLVALGYENIINVTGGITETPESLITTD